MVWALSGHGMDPLLSPVHRRVASIFSQEVNLSTTKNQYLALSINVNQLSDPLAAKQFDHAAFTFGETVWFSFNFDALNLFAAWEDLPLPDGANFQCRVVHVSGDPPELEVQGGPGSTGSAIEGYTNYTGSGRQYVIGFEKNTSGTKSGVWQFDIRDQNQGGAIVWTQTFEFELIVNP